LRVDYYAKMDIDGFSQMIDLVGGVGVDNPTLLDDPFSCN
jgi:anionic cell wall polymer biosynthesis LytR-Cps2A-Psr (LCP) family protein